MKYFLKGIGLGMSLNMANRLCDLIFGNATEGLLIFSSALIFCIVTTAFLLSDNVPHLLFCGFTGLFVMFFCDISNTAI